MATARARADTGERRAVDSSSSTQLDHVPTLFERRRAQETETSRRPPLDDFQGTPSARSNRFETTLASPAG